MNPTHAGRYKFVAAEKFWKSFYSLPAHQKESTRKAWQIFKIDPFDARLGTHKIHRLSAAWSKTVYAVVVEPDLRALFTILGNVVFTIDIGSHQIYCSP